MIRVFPIVVAATLAAGTLPASALSCAQWCSTYHCQNSEPRAERVCMNRCVAACRMIVKKRRAREHEHDHD